MGYETGSAFNSFVNGMDATQRWRANRQREEATDILLRSAKDAEGAHRAEMDDLGLESSNWGLKNPWMDRFLTLFKGRGAQTMQRPPKGEVSVSDMPMEDAGYEGMGMGEGMQGYGQDMPLEYANGGKPRSALRGYADGETIDDEEVKKRATESRAKNPGRVENATETVKKPVKGATDNPFGNVDTQGKGRVGGPGRMQGARRALDRGASSTMGKLGTAAALGATAAQTWNTPTEQYRERFGLETDDPTFWGDVGVRALGAASDLGNVLTFGQAGRFYRDLQDDGTPTPAATGQPAPAAPAATPAAAGGSATRSALGARQQGAPSPESMMDITKINMSDVGPESIPDFRTRDWSDFREKALQGLVARGMPLAQAAEEVDTQTMRMQQQGFNHFAMQAARLMQAGNQRGAMAAIKAAYQMFPSGDDVKLGTYNGQIYGVTLDEETGKPTGQPQLITPDSIAALVDQANKPGAWNEYAKDQRDFQLTLKKYLEMEKPQSEALSSAALTNARASMLRSEADMYGAVNGASGSGSRSDASFRNSERVFRQRLEMMGLTDPAQADQLAAIMSQMKQKYPQVSDNQIVEAVMSKVTAK